MQLLTLSGFHVEKTDAGLIRRGTKQPRGMISVGFPDLTAIYSSGKQGIPICVLIEVKTATGKLSADQVRIHAMLKARGLEPVVLRSLEETQHLIQRVKHDVLQLKWSS